MLVAHELAEAQAFADRLAVLDRGRLLQVGAPDEVVLRPASGGSPSWSATWVSCPPAGPGAGAVVGVHPERVSRGAHPDRGVVLTGTVAACRPGRARAGRPTWPPAGRVVTCRLAERAEAGGELAVTVVDPPWFGPDGARSTAPGSPPAGPVPPPGPADAEQVGRVTDQGAAATARLRLARQARGFSQQQLAGMAGVSRQAVSAVESGLSDPSLRVALALARALGMTVEELFGPGGPAPRWSARGRWRRSAASTPGSRWRRWAMRSSRCRCRGDSASRAGFLPGRRAGAMPAGAGPGTRCGRSGRPGRRWWWRAAIRRCRCWRRRWPCSTRRSR